MPYILKQQTTNSPGIITFTHNEALWGLPKQSKKVKNYLIETSQSEKWIYGVHIQGDCSHLKQWPLEPWQSFIMWPDLQASFLSKVPNSKKLPLTCINFMPEFLSKLPATDKVWDICIVSRASSIKRITETLHIIRGLLNAKPNLKVVFVVPDMRSQALGRHSYKKQNIDRNYFELPRKLFTCDELKNICFISSSQSAFGTFPLTDDLVSELMSKSKFMLLTSHLEGVPRVVAEALLVGTPCIVSKNLKSGINHILSDKNTLFIDDDIELATSQICNALEKYDTYEVDRAFMKNTFSEDIYNQKLIAYLSQKINELRLPIEGNWYLNDLHLNLACHGQKHNFQFMNDDRLFFNWLQKLKQLGDGYPNEEYLFGSMPLIDKHALGFKSINQLLKHNVYFPIRKSISPFLKKYLHGNKNNQ